MIAWGPGIFISSKAERLLWKFSCLLRRKLEKKKKYIYIYIFLSIYKRTFLFRLRLKLQNREQTRPQSSLFGLYEEDGTLEACLKGALGVMERRKTPSQHPSHSP